MNSSTSLQLGSRLISQSSIPYIIAEIGVNHEGSLDQAKYLIDLAKEGGADAAKFQSYKANTLASVHSPSYWDTKKEPTLSQHELFSKYDQFGPDDYVSLAEHCRQVGIDFLSTPFDDAAIDFLDPLISFYKIASADLTNTPFLRNVAQKGKPVILSTGASSLSEIETAINTLEGNKCEQIALLHCILNYPTDNSNANLSMIKSMARVFPSRLIGYSDHTLPDESMTSLVTASLLGAVVIEKHFTNDKTLPGNDHYHAMDVNDLRRFVSLINNVHELLGVHDYKQPIPSESISRQNARRSIVLSRDLDCGEIIDELSLISKRPGTGISPLHWDDIIGCKVSKDLKADHILRWHEIYK